MPWLALVLLSVFVIVVFPLRALRRRSLFDDAGRIDRSRRRPSSWKLADALFLVGFPAVFIGLALQGTGTLGGLWAAAGTLEILAVLLTVAAVAVAIWAQETMGAAWRTDIAPAEGAQLVTGGPFGVVRNPNYVAMATAILAVLLIAADVINVAGALVVLCSLALTARAEEPELVVTYGQPYREYAARVGRFVPLVGRLPS